MPSVATGASETGMRTTATSSPASRPRTVPVTLRPSARPTCTERAVPTTCALVRTIPSRRITTPVPEPYCGTMMLTTVGVTCLATRMTVSSSGVSGACDAFACAPTLRTKGRATRPLPPSATPTAKMVAPASAKRRVVVMVEQVSGNDPSRDVPAAGTRRSDAENVRRDRSSCCRAAALERIFGDPLPLPQNQCARSSPSQPS